MTRIRLIAAAVVVYCITSLYTLYSEIRRLFLSGAGAGAGSGTGFGAGSAMGRGSFRSGYAGQAGHSLINLSTWANDLGLLCLAVMITVFAFRPAPDYPKWLKWLVGLSVLLIIIQIVFSFVHTGGYGGNFGQYYSGHQSGQSGYGSFSQSSGNSAQPS
jgi:hypothetical protein